MKITDYMLITEDNGGLFHQEILDAINNGWQPFASPSVSRDNNKLLRFTQAVVKYEESQK